MSESLNSIHDWLEKQESGHAQLSKSPDTSKQWKPIYKLRAEIYEQLWHAVNAAAVLSNSQRRAVNAAVDRASLERDNRNDQSACVLQIATYINSCR